MSGQTIGAVVGAGVGYVIGGPSGAYWGWQIGGNDGEIIDPAEFHTTKEDSHVDSQSLG